MVFFRVEPALPTHPKFMRIPRRVRLEAIGLWTVAGAWSTDHLQDGAVPAYMVDEWGPSDEAVAGLVTTGLWDESSDGYVFHDWQDYQFTRVEVAAHREAERVRKENYRKRQAEKRENKGQSPAGQDAGQDAGRTEMSHGTPSDVPPLHSTAHAHAQHVSTDEVLAPPNGGAPAPKKPKVDRTRGERIPDPFLLTASMREWAATEVPGLDVNRETKVFVDHWRATPGAKGVKLDWVATWRNWMRRAEGYNDERGGAPVRTGPPKPDDFAAASKAKRAGWLATHGVTEDEYREWVDADGFELADARVNSRKAAQA